MARNRERLKRFACFLIEVKGRALFAFEIAEAYNKINKHSVNSYEVAATLRASHLFTSGPDSKVGSTWVKIYGLSGAEYTPPSAQTRGRWLQSLALSV